MLITCTGCGRNISSSARACPGCGTLPPKFIYCTKCGKSVPDTTLNCPFCGAARYSGPDRGSGGILLLLAGATALAAVVALSGVYLSRHGGLSSSSLSCSRAQPDDIEVRIESAGIRVDTGAKDGPLVGAVGVLVALEDKENNDVCASGTVTAEVHDYGTLDHLFGPPSLFPSGQPPMFSEEWTVNARDFSFWKFENEATEAKNERRLMWFSGRIPYSKFSRPSGLAVGQVEVVFRLANGVALKGKSRYFQIYQEVGG